MNEIWKQIPNFPNFKISQYGRVIRIKKHRKSTEKEIKQDNSSKYARITLHNEGTKCRFTIHTLVCLTFIGPQPTASHEVNHKDGIKKNNYFKNLEWVTHAQNVQHRFNKLGHRSPNLGRKLPKAWRDKCIKTLIWNRNK